MIGNYVKLSWRHLRKHRTYTLINIAGLAIGLTACMLILAYVMNELSYENMHEKRDRIQRVAVDFGSADAVMRLAGVMPALGPAAVENLPEVEKMVRIQEAQQPHLRYNDLALDEDRVYYVDSDFFDIFDLKLLSGDPQTALAEPNMLVITQSTARKYFGDTDPMGRTLTVNNEQDFKVAGVLQDIPANTRFQFEIMLSYATLLEQNPDYGTMWGQFGMDHTFFLVRPGVTPAELEIKLHDLFEQRTSAQFAEMVTFHSQPLTEIYLSPALLGDFGPHGHRAYIVLFSTIAIMILIVACINFMNLATARSFHRAKEVGLRKVLGAYRPQLIAQFLTESAFLVLFSFGAALFLFEMWRPLLNHHLNINWVIDFYQYPAYLLLMAGVVTFVILFSGSYPAFFLSRYQPVEVIKGALSTTSGLTFRRGLVIFQFMVAIMLIIGTVGVYRQLQFVRTTNLGFDKDDVLLFSTHEAAVKSNLEPLKTAFQQVSGVRGVTAAFTVPGFGGSEAQSVRRQGAPETDNRIVKSVAIDYDYLDALGLTLAAGRNFSPEFAADRQAVLLNETAVQSLGLTDPLHEMILIPATYLQTGTEAVSSDMLSVRILGVIHDFHVESLRAKIEPMFFYLNTERASVLAVKFKAENSAPVLAQLEAKWREIVPTVPFQPTYLSETYDRLYISEQKIGQLITVFSGLAIFIACLGLFGLAAFSTEQRTKEIGIRKVLGASVGQVVSLLSGEFLKFVILANLIAWPLAYVLMNHWLQDFAYRVEIGWDIFVFGAVTALIIAVLTVSIQAVKAARANPVESLKYE